MTVLLAVGGLGEATRNSDPPAGSQTNLTGQAATSSPAEGLAGSDPQPPQGQR